MASITIKKAVNSSVPYAVLTVSESSYSVANNTSTISWSLVLYRPSKVSSSASKSFSVTINGSTVKSGTYTIGGSGTKTIASGTVTVGHNSDGTKTMSFGASVQFGITWSGTSIGTVSNSSSMSLTTIPRVSDLSVNKSSVPADGTSTVTATASKKSSSFTDTITVKLGSHSMTVTSGTAFTIPKDWNDAITGTSATATVTVTTKSGSTTIGSKSVNLTVTVPDDVVPTISSISTSEAVTSVTAAFGNRFVKSLSQLNVKVNAAGVYGSTIKSCTVTLDGVKYQSMEFKSNALNTAGSVKIVATVTDSRGRTGTFEKSITVIDYTAPAIAGMTYYSCDADGNRDSSGTNTKVIIQGAISPVEDQNTRALVLKYKASSETSYTAVTLTVVDWNSEISAIISDTDPTQTYEFVAELADKISSVSFKMMTGVPVISRHAGGDGVTLFGEAEGEGFKVAGGKPSTFTGDILIEDAELEALWTSVFGSGGGSS